MAKKRSSRFGGMVSWKGRRDMFQNNDNVSGTGDQVDSFQDMEDVSLTGSPMDVKFIKKDETNANACRTLGIRWW